MPLDSPFKIIPSKATDAPSYIQLSSLKPLVIKPEIAAQFPSAAHILPGGYRWVRGVARERQEFWHQLCEDLYNTARYTQSGIDHLTSIILDNPDLHRQYYAANCSRNFDSLLVKVRKINKLSPEQQYFLGELANYLQHANRFTRDEWMHLTSIFQDIPVMKSKYEAAKSGAEFEALFQDIIRLEKLKAHFILVVKLNKKHANDECNKIFTAKGLLGVNFCIDFLHALSEGDVSDVQSTFSLIYTDEHLSRLYQEADTAKKFVRLLGDILKSLPDFVDSDEEMEDEEHASEEESADNTPAAASALSHASASSTIPSFFNKAMTPPPNAQQVTAPNCTP